MTRPIKFRAWDGEKIVHNVGVTCETDRGYRYKNPEPSEDYDYFPMEHVMQFTGLHDKNGVEIYEGDVVQQYEWTSDDVESKYGAPRLIDYNDYRGCFQYGQNKWRKDISKLGRCEVIGNIYENTELLNN